MKKEITKAVEKMTRAELKAVKETTVKSMTMKAQVMNVESNQCTTRGQTERNL